MSSSYKYYFAHGSPMLKLTKAMIEFEKIKKYPIQNKV